MDQRLLVKADRVIASLPPGKRESIREILVDARNHGVLSDHARLFLNRVTGSGFVADVLAVALAGASSLEVVPPADD